MIRLKFLIIFCMAIFCLDLSASAQIIGSDAGRTNENWTVTDAGHFTVFYGPDVNIEKVNKRVKIDFYDIIFEKVYYSVMKNGTAEQQMSEKLELILQKVEKILDMYPRKININVRIYKDQAQLNKTYSEVLGRANHKNDISFYVHKYTTIYTTQKVISTGLLAHEIGHAVIDHYFLILPPETVKEILAQHVELHLED